MKIPAWVRAKGFHDWKSYMASIRSKRTGRKRVRRSRKVRKNVVTVPYYRVYDWHLGTYAPGRYESEEAAIRLVDQLNEKLSVRGRRVRFTIIRVPHAGANPRHVSIPEKHQIKIAKQTLKMPDAMLGVMGGMTKEQAKEILRKYGVKKNPIACSFVIPPISLQQKQRP